MKFMASKKIEEGVSKEGRKKLDPRSAITVPVILCSECHLPMEITEKVVVPLKRGLFKKKEVEVPHLRYVCEKDNVEFLLSLERRGGGCFIATAAFETPWAYEINVLRQFRDNFLLQSKSGRKFISTYYRISPPIARAIERSAGLRLIFRALLDPIIRAAKSRDKLDFSEECRAVT
jgi:hypothetical protein